MRILHVIPSLALATGGPAVNAVALCRQILEWGHHATIATTDFVTPARSFKAKGGATTADFPTGADQLDIRVFPLNRPYSLAYSRKLGQFLGREVAGFDIVHIHSVNLYPQFAAWRAAERASIPIILSPRGALNPWIRGNRVCLKQFNDVLWQRRMLKSITLMHLTSDEELRSIQALGLNCKTSIVPNGLDIQSLVNWKANSAHLDFPRQWLGGFSGPLILNHGRLSAKKGLDLLVRALAETKLDDTARLVLVGSDNEGIGDQLQRLAEDLGVSARLTLLPNLIGDDLRSAIASADVWVLPSYTENFGMAVVEAMALKRPVVTTRAVDIATDAAAYGALELTTHDPSEIAAILRSLLGNSERSNELGNRAAEYVERFDWTVVGKQYQELYQSVAGGM